MHPQKRLHQRFMGAQGTPQLCPTLVPCLYQLLQTDGVPGQVLTHGATQKAMAVIDPNLRHIAGIVANDHILPDIGRQRQVQIPQPLKMDAITLHPAWFRHGQ
jgi:hypothetical protein